MGLFYMNSVFSALLLVFCTIEFATIGRNLEDWQKVIIFCLVSIAFGIQAIIALLFTVFA